MSVRTVAMPAQVLEQWDQIAAAQLCERAAELDAENEDLQRRLLIAEQLAERMHDDNHGIGVEGVALGVLA